MVHQASLSVEFSSKNTGVGCIALFQGIFLTKGSNPRFLYLSCWQQGSLPLAPPGKSQTPSYKPRIRLHCLIVVHTSSSEFLLQSQFLTISLSSPVISTVDEFYINLQVWYVASNNEFLLEGIKQQNILHWNLFDANFAFVDLYSVLDLWDWFSNWISGEFEECPYMAPNIC